MHLLYDDMIGEKKNYIFYIDIDNDVLEAEHFVEVCETDRDMSVEKD